MQKHLNRAKLWIATLLATSLTYNPSKELPPVNTQDFSDIIPILRLTNHKPDLSMNDDVDIFSYPSLLEQQKLASQDSLYIELKATNSANKTHTIAIHRDDLQKLLDITKNFQKQMGLTNDIQLCFSQNKRVLFYGINIPQTKGKILSGKVILDSDYASKADQKQLLFVEVHELQHIKDFPNKHKLTPHQKELRADSAATVLVDAKAGYRFLDNTLAGENRFLNRIIFNGQPVIENTPTHTRNYIAEQVYKKRTHPSSNERRLHILSVEKRMFLGFER